MTLICCCRIYIARGQAFDGCLYDVELSPALLIASALSKAANNLKRKPQSQQGHRIRTVDATALITRA